MLPIISALPIIHSNNFLRHAFAILLLCGAAFVCAQESINEDKPFAEAHVILQISDADEYKQTSVLNVANLLIKHYGGPERVDIEIIAFSKGVALYKKNNPLTPRINSLMNNDVRFVVCKNTLDTLTRVNKQAPEIIPGLIYVQTGVAHIIEKVQQGYTLIRP